MNFMGNFMQFSIANSTHLLEGLPFFPIAMSHWDISAMLLQDIMYTWKTRTTGTGLIEDSPDTTSA
jgi:hypothetical protein